MAHAEAAERELRAARDQSTKDHERIAELEAELAKAHRGVEQTKARAATPDDPPKGRPGKGLGAVLGRLQLRHARLLVMLSAVIAAAGASLLLASIFVWGFEPAMRQGHDAFFCGPNCGASRGGQVLPLGAALFAAGLWLVYNFRKPTRRRILRGKIQGGFQWRDLRSVDLGRLALTQCDFHDSDLRNATFEGATFGQCHFEGSDLRGATLDGATFEQCTFDGAQLEGVCGNKTTFVQCHLRGTAIAKGLEGATFEQCEV